MNSSSDLVFHDCLAVFDLPAPSLSSLDFSSSLEGEVSSIFPATACKDRVHHLTPTVFRRFANGHRTSSRRRRTTGRKDT